VALVDVAVVAVGAGTCAICGEAATTNTTITATTTGDALQSVVLLLCAAAHVAAS
jgi:hypothetical protein